MNPSLSEYHVPVHMDVPEIDVLWTDIPDPHAPMGAHGIGEIGANRQPAKLTFLSQHCFARRPKLFESLFVPISEERAYPATVVQHMLLS